jgi:hypothetical protein
LQAELAKKDADIAKLRAQVKEKETKASKTAATEAAIESLEQEKVRICLFHLPPHSCVLLKSQMLTVLLLCKGRFARNFGNDEGRD